MWLLACSEIVSNSAYSPGEESDGIYEWFASHPTDTASKIKKMGMGNMTYTEYGNGTAVHWWLRSISNTLYNGNDIAFTYITMSGSGVVHASSNQSYGISPCFCL